MTAFPTAEPMAAHVPAVCLRRISKIFGATRAVDGVNIDIELGEVHAIVGENGAGKSTLMRILAGTFADYEGEILFDGKRASLTSPARARAHGVALVHQELSLLPEFSIAENIFLGREPRARLPGFVNRREMEKAASRVLRECGVSLNPSTQVESLSIAERQLVEIVKGVSASPRVLILDEPTSSLTVHETRELFSIVRRLTAGGTAVIYISHKLDEVFSLADRVTVLRDGRKVASRVTREWKEDELVRAMVGRDLSALFPHTPIEPGDVRLEVAELERRGSFGPVSLSVRGGEIVGLYGIIGSGRSEMADAIFGLAPADAGTIRVDGKRISIRSPRTALRAGISMSPEDRRARGLVPMLSVGTNMSLSALGRFTFMGFVKRKTEWKHVSSFLTSLLVRARSPSQEVAALSGGNQQKVVIGRSLMTIPRVLILDEPTRGIDVVAKAEVHGTIDRLAHQGLAILLISSELPEILGMSDRIFVMRDRRLIGSLARKEASEEKLVALAAGTRQSN